MFSGYAPKQDGREPMDAEDFALAVEPVKPVRKIRRIPPEIQTVEQLLARYCPIQNLPAQE